jgi:hypothetical protein
MPALLLNRRFWNPVLALSGGLTLVSGIYLFFHLKSHPIVLTHEWSSIIFIVACAVHLALNWKSLLKSLGNKTVACTLLAVILLFGLCMSFTDIKKIDKHRQSMASDIETNNEHRQRVAEVRTISR